MTADAAHDNDSGELLFEEGIIGVPRARRFVLMERPGSPVRVLRSLDIEGFALPVVDPALVDPEYRPRLGERILEAVKLDAGCPVLLLAVAALEPAGPTVNLRAPLVINVRDRIATQVILDDRNYPLRAPLREDAESVRSAG